MLASMMVLCKLVVSAMLGNECHVAQASCMTQ